MAVVFSGTISLVKNYFKKLRELGQKYHNSSRGDKFYIWGNSYYYKTEAEMDKFIASEYCQMEQLVIILQKLEEYLKMKTLNILFL